MEASQLPFMRFYFIWNEGVVDCGCLLMINKLLTIVGLFHVNDLIYILQKHKSETK